MDLKWYSSSRYFSSLTHAQFLLFPVKLIPKVSCCVWPIKGTVLAGFFSYSPDFHNFELSWSVFNIQYEQCCFIKRLLQDELPTKERLGVWSWVLLNVDNFCSQEMWHDFNLLSTVWVSSSKSKTCCLIKPVVLISWNEHKNIWKREVLYIF